MGCDVMSVRLWLPRIGVLGVVVDALERLVVRVASTVRRPCCAVAKRYRVGWQEVVMGLLAACAAVVGEHRRRRRCRVLLVDETSVRERRRYVTVLVNGAPSARAARRAGSSPRSSNTTAAADMSFGSG
ncbi:hypothetical protein [Candidatus Poriferisodalis sp.]|uniref:hypothetical protein n=1 Tax=Candidatus Poriferisodalis sp. TaxID=3101277 RepID=UPI003B01DFB3